MTPYSPKQRSHRTYKPHRRISVRGVRRSQPDVRKLARALIALAMAQAEADAQAQDQTSAPKSSEFGKSQEDLDVQ